MPRNWLETLAAWLKAQRDYAWAHDTAQQGDVRASWGTELPWEYADDEDLILYATLITAAHY